MAGIGGRIRGVRFRLDRSEQTFADLLGVDTDLVRSWERGEAIDRVALALIASTTDTAMEWLIAGLTAPEVEAIRAAARVRATAPRPDPATVAGEGAPASVAPAPDPRDDGEPAIGAGRKARRRP